MTQLNQSHFKKSKNTVFDELRWWGENYMCLKLQDDQFLTLSYAQRFSPHSSENINCWFQVFDLTTRCSFLHNCQSLKFYDQSLIDNIIIILLCCLKMLTSVKSCQLKQSEFSSWAVHTAGRKLSYNDLFSSDFFFIQSMFSESHVKLSSVEDMIQFSSIDHFLLCH